MITISQEFLNELISTKRELENLKRKPRFGFKSLALAVLIGWLAVPVIVAGVPLPTPVKEVIVAMNVWYSDTGLNLKCNYRQ